MLYRPHAELDETLDAIVEILQITPTQAARAVRAYRDVGGWLSAPESPLTRYRPQLYPQGSFAIGTTVRPWQQIEYDLDIVLEVAWFDRRPMDLYRMLIDRLDAHGDYSKRLEQMRRCARLQYADEFHLDVLPARHDRLRGTTCIEVPDKKEPTLWKPSNPIGFRRCFEEASRRADGLAKAVRQEPLPVDLPTDEKTILQKVVQLLKRRRDVTFHGDDEAPRSIVLTTLAGEDYRGEATLYAALTAVVFRIRDRILAAQPRQIEVRNPANPDELLSESWRDHPEQYRAFVSWIDRFAAELERLGKARALPDVAEHLDRVFENGLGKRAVERFARGVAAAEPARSPSSTGPALLLGGASGGRAIPRHTNYGS